MLSMESESLDSITACQKAILLLLYGRAACFHSRLPPPPRNSITPPAPTLPTAPYPQLNQYPPCLVILNTVGFTWVVVRPYFSWQPAVTADTSSLPSWRMKHFISGRSSGRLISIVFKVECSGAHIFLKLGVNIFGVGLRTSSRANIITGTRCQPD